MKKFLPVAILATSLVVIGGASSASARGSYEAMIPNSPNGCNTCHTNGGGTPRNAFGLDVEDTLDGANVDWSALWELDSDDDGQTNGQELGDPCGVWTDGSAPRSDDISDPADDQSTSADPDGGCDSTGGEPEPEADGDLDGGCGGSNATNDGPPAALAVLAVGVAMFIRRRRRR